MKGNPLLPYAFLAIIGIALMLIFSFQGIKQEKELMAAQTGGAAPQAAANPEEIVKQTCTSCHGANLEGSVGPNLQKIGSKYSQDEIKTILMNGRGNMPAGLVTSDGAAKVAAYLEGKK